MLGVKNRFWGQANLNLEVPCQALLLLNVLGLCLAINFPGDSAHVV